MVAGRRVAYQRHSSPAGGKEIVLLHGAGGSEHSFDALLPHLAAFGTVVPALPGRSGSEGPPLRTAAEAARWVEDFLGVLEVGDFVAAGHSFGGAIALELGLAAASLPALKGLALLCTGARLRVHPDILRQAAEAGDATTIADWRAADAFDRLHEVATISLPTLVVGGTTDSLTPPRYSRYLAEKITGARLRLLEDAGHDLIVSRAEEVAAELGAFLDRLPG